MFIMHTNGKSGYHNTETNVQPFHCPWHVCVCACVSACARAWMHVCSEHYSCVCGCRSVKEAGAGEWGENVSEIFTYLFYIY